MRGYRGNRKLIGKVVIPALIVLVMMTGAWGGAIGPIASPEATGGNPTVTPNTRAGSLPSSLDGNAGDSPQNDGGASEMDAQGNLVSSEIVVNEKLFARADTAPVLETPKNALGRHPPSGESTSKILSSDPAPAAGGIDAGGPYGGPTTFEGDPVPFDADVTDPTLANFRWDVNGDAKWDTGVPGNPWVGDPDFPYQYRDDYFGNALIDAWDGISTTTTAYAGNILGGSSPAYYGLVYGAWTVGNRYQATKAFEITNLRTYRWLTYWTPVEMGLWSDSGTLLRSCMLTTNNLAWNGCASSIAPYSIAQGQYFRIAVRLTTGYWMGILMTAFPSNPYVTTDGTYRSPSTGASLTFPSTIVTTSYSTHVDFAWSYTEVIPLTVSDTAAVEVHNVAPTVYDLTVSPDTVYEGTPAEFTGMFNDPGLDDKWQFRWCYGDGTCDAWSGIKVGSGITRMENILVYSDVAPHYARMALDFYGVSYTFVDYVTNLPTPLNSRQWDLIIYQSYYIAYIAPIIEDALMNQINGGAVVLYNNWYSANRNTHPLFAYFGATTASSLTTPLPMYSWESTDQLFNSPLQPPLTLNPTHNQYGIDGFRLNVQSHAFDPLGYSVNRQSGQAAMAVRNDRSTIFNGFTPQNYQGDSDFDGDPDMLELMVNEIRLVTGPEVEPSMPWPVPAVKHVFRDDHPVSGTPADSVSATLEVKDDDDGKLMGGSSITSTGFPNAGSWPAGWAEVAGSAWQSTSSLSGMGSNVASLFFTFCSPYTGLNCRLVDQTLRSVVVDLSAIDWSAPIVQVTFSLRQNWYGVYPCSQPWGGNICQEGWIELSLDGFATKTELQHWWTFNPSSFNGVSTFDLTSLVAGAPSVQIQFRMWMYDDYWWEVDDFSVAAFWGEVVDGLGTDSTSMVVNNVPPRVYGGPTSGLVGEAIPFDFANYKIDDPTLWDPRTGAWGPVSTEWFAYRWNFDDGMVSPWTYTGSLQLPKLRVLFLHTINGGGAVGASFISLLQNIDVVGTLDQVEFLFLSPAQIPSLSQMLNYDVIVFATNYAIFSSTFDLTRREIGNRLADYMDITGRGVITLMATYDLSTTYGDLFSLLGRYPEEDYGAFEKPTYAFGSAALGTVYQSNHPLMQGVTRLSSPLIYSGDYRLTAGAQLIADWENGNSAIGVKEMPNGARSVNVGSFTASGGSVIGGDAARFLRNAIVWASRTVVPTNVVPTQTHTFADNGLYNVDLQLVDDDMGFMWDATTNSPVAIPGETPTVTHTIIPVEIQNKDPTIDTSSIDVFIAANLCLRVSGKEWNTVSLKVFTDGVQSGGVSITRASGSPNDQAKCAFTRIDLMASHTFGAEVQFTPLPGATSGSNPWWIIVEPWRAPITPGHGAVTFSGGAQVERLETYLQTVDLGNLKASLLDSKQGARIDFSATAMDPGSDDLAFVWMWSDGSPDTARVHNNLDGTVTQGVIGDPQFVGFGEPYFDRAANSGRSPAGTAPFTVRDNVVHAYNGDSLRFWVVLIVLDDDNSRGYPSGFFHDGTDMEFIFVDLT